MAKLDLEIAKFKCQICNKEQTININDNSTFLSKTPHEEFFGMKLETYRSEHIIDNEKHVNVVLIDHKGLFRGYIDSYKEDVSSKTQIADKRTVQVEDFMVLGAEVDTLIDDNQLNCFVLINNNSWIMEIVKLKHLSIKEITRLILDRITETKKVYHELPKPLRITIADLEFFIFVKKNFIVALSFKEKPIDTMLDAIEMLTDRYYVNPIPPRKRSLKLFIKILGMNSNNELDKKLIFRLLTDDLIYTNIRTKYLDRIPQILSNVTRRYKISEDILISILKGEETIIEALEQDHFSLKNYEDLIEVIDYVNRRKLLS